MVGTTISDKTMKVGITLPISLVKRADKGRGDVPRSTFIRRAIEQFLRKDDKRK
jgi:metal-responsive CopG/Arc/MetJ family transcriptional regulator